MTQSAADCAICLKHRGEGPLVAEPVLAEELVLAFHAAPDDGRAYLGHLLVETRRHVPGLADLDSREAEAVGRVAAQLSRALHEIAGAEHVYAAVIGHHYPHFHLHLLPRYAGAPRDLPWYRLDEWEEMRRGPDEIRLLAERLR